MTETEWLAAIDPIIVLKCMQQKPSRRKGQLLCCAYLRAQCGLDQKLTRAVAAFELIADGGKVNPDDAKEFIRDFSSIILGNRWSDTLQIWREGRMKKQESDYMLALFHDIFGNSFRQLTANSAWLTSTVLALATGIYEEKAFDRMPIIADALQDASCDNEDILTHCRGPGPHTRGCWVVDLVLNEV
jgi:hypothetical protein